MLFQTLDDKTECVGICCDGKLYFDPLQVPSQLSRTWSYAPYLREMDVEYASLYLEGAPLLDHVPEYLQDDWNDVYKKLGAFKRSLQLGQVDLKENCFFDLVPNRFLLDFCAVKDKITAHIFKMVPRPDRYEFYHHVSSMLGDIAGRTVTVDYRTLISLKTPKLKNQIEQILSSGTVTYNQFGTKTGRLTTTKNSFPILTLSKDLRSAIKPNNDVFVEIDFNGAEVRTLLGLLGKEQPVEDVHDFHLQEVFSGLSSRAEAKVAFFAWLYGARNQGPAEDVKKLEAFYDKEVLLHKYYQGTTVTTPFSKVIHGVSPHHALNYIIQSTAAELTLKQALKVEHFLRTQSQGSELAFIIHDSLVLDMKKEDVPLLKSIIYLMSSTNFGTFGVNIKKGFSLGSLRKIRQHG